MRTALLATAATVLVLSGAVSRSVAAAETVARPDNAVDKGVVERYVVRYTDATTLEELQFASDFKAEHADILRLYRAFFNREADLAGAKYWLATWDQDGRTDKLGRYAGYFTTQQEYRNIYGGSDDAEFLNRVYANMLGRAPDPAGFDYWLSKLQGTHPDTPGKKLSRGGAMRWITQDVEFTARFPYGHQDRSDHPSDQAECSAENVGFANLTISAIYRLRDGAIRELCFGWQDPAVETAWTRMVNVADPGHFSPVALLAVFEGSGSGIVAYAGSARGVDNTYIGDLWLISAQDVATAMDPTEADLTMVHELTHVFTQVDSEIDYTTQSDDCGARFVAFSWCFAPDAYLNQWVQAFWSESELAIYEDPNVDNRTMCVDGHDFIGTYATTSPQEDFAESFSAYVYGVAASNQSAKFNFFDQYPELQAYKDRAVAAERVGYPNNFGTCTAP